jgi:hypothetical protein
MINVDPNDPEVIESLTFLLVPKEEKIQTQSRPFDPKKNVFVRDAKEGFIDGVIQSEDGDKVTVKTRNGGVIKIYAFKLKFIL